MKYFYIASRSKIYSTMDLHDILQRKKVIIYKKINKKALEFNVIQVETKKDALFGENIILSTAIRIFKNCINKNKYYLCIILLVYNWDLYFLLNT
jgi:hypothetical protein